MNAEGLLDHYERIADAPDAISRLRRFILDLAVRGKLLPQDPNDEPASELLTRIADEKARLVKAGEIKKPKVLPSVEEPPFDLPQNWRWTPIREVASDRGQEIPRSTFTYIDVTAIDKEAGVVADPKVLEASEAPSRARKITRKGDVIYSCVRPYLLNVAVIETDFDPPPIASTAFAILNGHGLVIPRYLWIVLRSPFMIECVEENQRGQAYPAINDADFAILPLPLPPFAEQHRIVAKVDELMGLCDRLEAARSGREAVRDRLAAASLVRLNTPDPETFEGGARFALDALPALTTRPDQIKALRQTILNLAVRGKLVPQDLNDEPASELLKRIAAGGNAREVDAKHQLPANWAWALIEDCFVISGGIQKTPARTPKANAFPYLGVSNVYRGRLDLANIKKFELAPGELERFRLALQDILVVEGNGSASEIGRCAVWNGEIENCVHQNHIIRCRPKTLQLTAYTALYLNSPDGMAEMRRLAITSAGLFSLSVGKIRKILYPLPPLAEQQRIVAKVDALMALCDQLEASLTAATATRRRLLDVLLAEALEPTGFSVVGIGDRPTVALANGDTAKVTFAERSAYILALAYERHRVARRERTFGHVKAQKILHLVEAEAGFDLGRAPIRDAAGPNDFQHMLAVEQWAREHDRFVFETNGAGYQLRQLSGFSKSLKIEHCPDPQKRAVVTRLIDIFVPMDTRQAEIFATVYSALNNLLIEGKSPTDAEIVRAARDDWHPDKLKLPAGDFFAALAKLRHEGIVPKGAGKFVDGPHQKALFN